MQSFMFTDLLASCIVAKILLFITLNAALSKCGFSSVPGKERAKSRNCWEVIEANLIK
jgi:hypothetical protein